MKCSRLCTKRIAITAKPLRASPTSLRGVFVDYSMGVLYDCFFSEYSFYPFVGRRFKIIKRKQAEYNGDAENDGDTYCPLYLPMIVGGHSHICIYDKQSYYKKVKCGRIW